MAAFIPSSTRNGFPSEREVMRKPGELLINFLVAMYGLAWGVQIPRQHSYLLDSAHLPGLSWESPH